MSRASFISERLPPPLPSFLRVVCIVRGVLCPRLPVPSFTCHWSTSQGHTHCEAGSWRPRAPTSPGNFQGPGRRRCLHRVIRFSTICKGRVFKLWSVKPAVYFHSVFPSITPLLCWSVVEWLRTFLEAAKGKLPRDSFSLGLVRYIYVTHGHFSV